MSKSPKRARPRVIKEVNCVENSFMPVPSWMKSMLENAKSDTAKTITKKIISGSAFLSTVGVKPILGTRIAEIFMILSSCTQTHSARTNLSSRTRSTSTWSSRKPIVLQISPHSGLRACARYCFAIAKTSKKITYTAQSMQFHISNK